MKSERASRKARRSNWPLKNDAPHGLTVSTPNRDKLTMRFKPLKSLGLILSLSKDEAKNSAFSAAKFSLSSRKRAKRVVRDLRSRVCAAAFHAAARTGRRQLFRRVQARW